MKTEDRGTVKRMICSDCEQYLLQLEGQPYREYRMNWNHSGAALEQHDHPLQLNIELTSYCNLRCKMCNYNFIENKTHKHLSLELVDQIVNEAKSLHVESLWLGAYSEGLLHPDIIEILRKFAQVKSLDYWLLTNGTLLNKRVAETIVDIPLTWLTVSLDAATAETYKQIRGGRLDIVERNIDEFLKIREEKGSKLPFLRVSFVDMKENHNELELFRKKWEGKADIVDVQTLMDFSENAVNAPIDGSFVCRDLYRMLSIKYDGELLPCCSAAYESAGKNFYLKDVSIQQFWNSNFHKALLESVRSKKYLPHCMRCVRCFRPMH